MEVFWTSCIPLKLKSRTAKASDVVGIYIKDIFAQKGALTKHIHSAGNHLCLRVS